MLTWFFAGQKFVSGPPFFGVQRNCQKKRRPFFQLTIDTYDLTERQKPRFRFESGVL